MYCTPVATATKQSYQILLGTLYSPHILEIASDVTISEAWSSARVSEKTEER